MKKRIWELDALRGILVLGMIAVHLLFDLSFLFGLIDLSRTPWFLFLSAWGGVPFVFISGICATFARNNVRRGLWVFGCGMLCTAATLWMYLAGFSSIAIVIYFGVLHCLGVCMMLWPLMKKLPNGILVALGIVCIALGLFFSRFVRLDHSWLFPFGLVSPRFYSSDFFPLLPNLGYFLLGGVAGRTLYSDRQSRLPRWNETHPVIRFFRWCGKHSLPIYLIHQPLLTGLVWLLSWIVKK